MKLSATAASLFSIAALSLASMAQAAIVTSFSDDFESGLGQWQQAPLFGPHGIIVNDPLNPGNKVLSFRRPGLGGSVFSTDLIQSSGSYTLSFDYLGLPTQGSRAGNLGGFVGYTHSVFPLLQHWLGGTIDAPSFFVNGGTMPDLSLIDNGQWNSYTLVFNALGWITDDGAGGALPIRLTLQDWAGSGLTTRDAFFDNVSLRATHAVSEPGSMALVGLALMAAGAATRRRAAHASGKASD